MNVNTARAVYARLESEGVVRSEQGRGTFVAGPPQRRGSHPARAARARSPSSRPRWRASPRRRPWRTRRATRGRRPAAALLSTEGLEAVRDELVARLSELDAQRAAVLQRLEQLGVEEAVADAGSRRATPSLAGARIRWVGA